MTVSHPAPAPAPPVRPRETARVLAPPPLFPLAVIGLAEGLRGWNTLPFMSTDPVWRLTLALSLALAAVLLAGSAILTLRRAHTPVEPWKPTRAIVSTGSYAFSRNPIYVSFLAVQLAYGWARPNAWALLLLPVTIALLQVGVIAREERYLTSRFGESYLAYRRRVRRWV